MSICTMCLQPLRKGWPFLIRKYCFTFTQSSKRKSRKSLLKCVDGKTSVLQCCVCLVGWLIFIIMIHGVKRKKKTMKIVCMNFVLRSLYSMQITGVPNNTCFITISTKLCTPNRERALRQNCMPLLCYSTWTDLAEEMVQTPSSPSFEADVTSLNGEVILLMYFFLLSVEGGGGGLMND